MKKFSILLLASLVLGAGCRANTQATITTEPQPQVMVPSQPSEPLPTDANGNPKTGDAELDGYINDGAMLDSDASIQMDDATADNPPSGSSDEDASIYSNL
ncbi:MAG: hypothetical protein ABIO72_01030 [Patescibacteria group bacterium]